jgi:hypothetical protein
VLTLLCALALSEDLSRRRQILCALLLGFALTGTFYVSASGYTLVLPALLWAVPTLWRLRLMPYAAGMAVVGAAPNVLWALWHHTTILPGVGIERTTMSDRLKLLFDSVGREFIGVAHSFGTPGMPIAPARLILWLGFAAVGVALLVRFRSILRMVLLRLDGRRPFDIVLVATVLVVIVYAVSKYAWIALDPRYLYASNPILILLLASVASPTAWRSMFRFVRDRVQRSPADPKFAVRASQIAAGIVGLAMIALIGIPTVVMLRHPALDSNGNVARSATVNDPGIEQAVTALHQEGIQYAYATYWIAVNIDFLAAGRLTCVSYGTGNRFKADRTAADNAPADKVAWIEPTTKAPDGMRALLTKHHISFRARVFGPLTVYDQLGTSLRPSKIGVPGI